MRSTGAISSAQLRELEADIRSELARIERSLARDAQEEALLADSSSLRVASGTASDGGLTVTLTGRVHARYAELTEALRRIEDGRYGVCGHCGEGIAYGRLLVVPEATNCLECR
ncbi:MAG TPA: TraR/DksA C4-type zinc finger protein [Gemmatimonadaceae bacterium]|nr:TraR/DksA C4-type zinc finger protein [Gemmatimonadaceae bacterium]